MFVLLVIIAALLFDILRTQKPTSLVECILFAVTIILLCFTDILVYKAVVEEAVRSALQKSRT